MSAMPPTDDPRPSAVYWRVSDEDKAINAPSPDVQISLARAASMRRGNEVPDAWVFGDKLSGKDNNRPDLQKILAHVKAGEVKDVTFYNVARLVRSMEGAVDVVKAFAKGKCRIYVLDRYIDLDDPEQEMAFYNEVSAAQQYRKRVAKDIRNAQHRMVQPPEHVAPKLASQPPFWYRRVPPPPGKKTWGWELDPHWTPIVWDMLRWYADGDAYLTIAYRLTEAGVISPNGFPRWAPNTVRRTILHPSHQGRQRFGSMEGPWPLPRLPDRVTETGVESFAALAERVHARAVRSAFRSGPNTVSHELHGLARCALCGGGLSRTNQKPHTGNVHTFTYLVCNGKALHYRHKADVPLCRLLRVRSHVTDKLLEALVEVFRDARPVAREEAGGGAPRLIEERMLWIEERKKREKAMLRLGEITTDEYEAQIRALNAERARLAPPPPPRKPSLPESVAAAWAGWNVAERNEALRELVTAVVVSDAQIVVRFRDFPWDNWPESMSFQRPYGPWKLKKRP